MRTVDACFCVNLRRLEPPLKLMAKHHKAIAALVTQPSVAKAAEQCGLNDSTLFRWLRDPDFREALEDANRAAFDQYICALNSLVEPAVKTLSDLINGGPDVPAAVRARAALGALERLGSWRELYQLQPKIDELNRLLGEMQRERTIASAASGTPAGESESVPPARGAPVPGPDSERSDLPHASGGIESGPLAGGTGSQSGTPGGRPLHSPQREDPNSGVSGTGPLLD